MDLAVLRSGARDAGFTTHEVDLARVPNESALLSALRGSLHPQTQDVSRVPEDQAATPNTWLLPSGSRTRTTTREPPTPSCAWFTSRTTSA